MSVIEMSRTFVRFFSCRMGTALCGPFVLAATMAGCVLPQRDADANGQLAPVLARTIILADVRGTRPNLGIPGRIDHMAYDSATKRLFVAALENGSLEVVDLERGQRVRSIGGLSRPQGVAIVPSLSCAVTACGGNGVAHVYDTRTLAEQTNFDIGPDADNARYDAAASAVYISYGDAHIGAIAVLEPGTWKKLRDLPFPSKPESFQLNPGGNGLFANVPGGVRAAKDGVVASLNRLDGKIEAWTQLKDRGRNFPMALDPVHKRLFIACRKPARVMALDVRNCAVLAEAPCTDDSDDLFYDAQTGRVFVIGGGFRPDIQDAGTASPVSPPGEMGAIDIFSVGRNGELARVASTPTGIHARTGLFVPSRRAIYVAVPMRDGRDAEIREYKLPR